LKTSTIAIVFSSVLCAVALADCGSGTSAPAPTSSPMCSAVSSSALPAGIRLHFPVTSHDEIEPGVVAVRFQHNRVSSEALAVLSRISARQMTEMNEQGAMTFSLPPNRDPLAAAASLRGVPGVASAGPVILRHTLAVTPNDPWYSDAVGDPTQWDFFTIGMPNAWGVSEGASTVRIAIIDTGYDTHNPDLVSKVVSNGTIVYDLGTGLPDTGASIEDKDGHGSDVSGIAAADTDNATDVAGVGWTTMLLEARVFPYACNAGANTEDIAAAINWAVANGAKVINLSLGGPAPDDTYEEPAVAQAINDGVVVVAAAGNDGTDTIDYPAADPGVIAVGASGNCEDMQNVPGSGHECVATYSNYGSQLSVVAPGGNPDAAQQNCTTPSCIDYLQWILNLDSTEGPYTEQLGLFAGTSQATPHVSGAVALMRAIDSSLTPAQALSIIKSSADNISDPHQGSGRLDVYNALLETP
jgi:serine protease